MGALRIADFRLLLCARTASQAGAWLMVVAIPVHVYALTGSAAATALAPAIESLPALLVGPVAGVFADRWDRRRLMITADLLRALTVLERRDGRGLWHRRGRARRAACRPRRWVRCPRRRPPRPRARQRRLTGPASAVSSIASGDEQRRRPSHPRTSRVAGSPRSWGRALTVSGRSGSFLASAGSCRALMETCARCDPALGDGGTPPVLVIPGGPDRASGTASTAMTTVLSKTAIKPRSWVFREVPPGPPSVA